MNINLDAIQAMTLSAAAVVPIIVAVCQVFKFWISDKWAPFLSLVVGIIITFLLADNFRADIGGTILTGILFGLAASGLYSGISSSSKILKAEKAEREERKRKRAEERKHNNTK